MHYQKGKDRVQVFMTSMENWVREDSWTHVVDLFVDAMPVREFGFRHAALGCTQSVNWRAIDRPTQRAYVDRNDARVRKYLDIYQLRQELVEYPFGTIKRHWGVDYTYLRGSPKVIAEYTFATICYNHIRMVYVKGITWFGKRLKRLFCAVFAVLSAHRASRVQGYQVALWWMSVVFYTGFITFTEWERVVT